MVSRRFSPNTKADILLLFQEENKSVDNDKDNFDRMFAFAELAAKQHNDRRQLSFKIVISYVTLLALAFYQVIKPSPEGSDFADSWWIIGSSVLGLLIVHVFYCVWQRFMHIASNNDVRRRDFYLKKAECIAYHMSQNLNTNFVPSSTKRVILNLGATDNTDPVTERELFKQSGPDIYIFSKKLGTPLPKWCKDLHYLALITGPTTLFLLLVASLILKKGNWFG